MVVYIKYYHRVDCSMVKNYGIQLKIKGDDYNGHYTNGMSMADSVSVGRCKIVNSDQAKTVYACDDYTVTAHHINNGSTTTCHTTFRNTSGADITLDMLASFCIDIDSADIMHRAKSYWSAEGKLLSQNLTELNMERSWSGHGTRVEKFGQIGSMPVRGWFPFVALEDTANGEVVGVQLYCASSWQIEVTRRTDPLTICGGLADYDYGHWCKTIAPGEEFTTPKAVIATGKSLYEVCDKLVKAQKPDISPVDADMPVIYNEYCTTWGNPTIENIEKIAQRLSGSGIRYLVIDSGWYKEPEQDWWATIGDWNENKTLFPNGIKEVCDLIKSYGMIPGIWFEFEKVAWLTELYSQEEHLLHRDGVPISVDGQRFLDMRQQWSQDYLTKKVIHFLRDNGFGYIKIDYNDSIGVGCDGAESLGEGLRQTILGTQKFFAKLKAELPDLVIENCSSGGHRLEPSMMELASQASFSDAHECTSIPIIASNVQRFVRPEQSQIWAVLRSSDSTERLYYSLISGFLGRLCLSGDIFDISDQHWQIVLDAIRLYDRIKDVIKDGTTTLIHNETMDYNQPTGHLAVKRELGTRALLTIHTFQDGANPPVARYTEGYTVTEAFGSQLDGDYQACAYILEKN